MNACLFYNQCLYFQLVKCCDLHCCHGWNSGVATLCRFHTTKTYIATSTSWIIIVNHCAEISGCQKPVLLVKQSLTPATQRAKNMWLNYCNYWMFVGVSAHCEYSLAVQDIWYDNRQSPSLKPSTSSEDLLFDILQDVYQTISDGYFINYDEHVSEGLRETKDLSSSTNPTTGVIAKRLRRARDIDSNDKPSCRVLVRVFSDFNNRNTCTY